MNWSRFKTSPGGKILLNKYIIILIGFVIWILFFDSNAWLTAHSEMDTKIEEKLNNKSFFKAGITRDSARLQQLQSPEGLERFARERYQMKKENEEIYIIEYEDSLKAKTDE